jgi:hypothetical protein
MQILYTTLGVLFGLALLAAVGVGAYWGLVWVVGLFASLDPKVAALTGILSALALLAAAIIAGSRDRAMRRLGVWQIDAERAAAYSLFLDHWQRSIQGRPDPRGADAAATAITLRSLDLGLALYGSAEVLKAHHSLHELLAVGRLGEPDARTAIVAAVVEIRKELGSDSKGLTPVDLTRAIFSGRDVPQSAVTAAPPASPAGAASPNREIP